MIQVYFDKNNISNCRLGVRTRTIKGGIVSWGQMTDLTYNISRLLFPVCYHCGHRSNDDDMALCSTLAAVFLISVTTDQHLHSAKLAVQEDGWSQDTETSVLLPLAESHLLLLRVRLHREPHRGGPHLHHPHPLHPHTDTTHLPHCWGT